MKRHIIPILTFLSLVLCALTLWHWALSFLGETIRIASVRGGFALVSIDAFDDFVNSQFGGTSRDVIRFLHGLPASDGRSMLGFTYQSGTRQNASYWLVILPYWFFALLTAILPIRWWLLGRRRRGRIITGRCLGCGYDLRGSPERCPECGAPAPPAAPAAPAAPATRLSESAIIGR